MANFKSFLGAAGAAALASLAMSTAALADDERTFGYSVTISGTSDYMFRGISFNDNSPAFQPFVEFTYGNSNLTWYLDFWGSNISGIYQPFETDVYAGVRFPTGPIAWDLAVWYYTYPDAKSFSDTDYFELKAAGTYNLTPALGLTLTGYYTPNQKNYGSTWTIEGAANYTLPTFAMFTPTLGGAVGYSEGDNGFSACACDTVTSYTYWNAGLKLAVDKYFMDFRYWDTDIPSGDVTAPFADSRFVFTAGVNLP